MIIAYHRKVTPSTRRIQTGRAISLDSPPRDTSSDDSGMDAGMNKEIARVEEE
jgi:hypothetical protein